MGGVWVLVGIVGGVLFTLCVICVVCCVCDCVWLCVWLCVCVVCVLYVCVWKKKLFKKKISYYHDYGITLFTFLNFDITCFKYSILCLHRLTYFFPTFILWYLSINIRRNSITINTSTTTLTINTSIWKKKVFWRFKWIWKGKKKKENKIFERYWNPYFFFQDPLFIGVLPPYNFNFFQKQSKYIVVFPNNLNKKTFFLLQSSRFTTILISFQSKLFFSLFTQ